MLDFLLFLFLVIIANIIGTILGEHINGIIVSRQLSKQIFKKSDFENIDNDFFNDSSNSSITDIDIDNSNIDIDNSNENEQKFF